MDDTRHTAAMRLTNDNDRDTKRKSRRMERRIRYGGYAPSSIAFLVDTWNWLRQGVETWVIEVALTSENVIDSLLQYWLIEWLVLACIFHGGMTRKGSDGTPETRCC